MHKSPTWLNTIVRDLFAVGIMAAVGACCGFALNQFRERPLPVVYSPKVERIQHAIARFSMATTTTNQSSPAQRGNVIPPSDAPEVRHIDLPAFRNIAEGKTKAVVIDARPGIFYHGPRSRRNEPFTRGV